MRANLVHLVEQDSFGEIVDSSEVVEFNTSTTVPAREQHSSSSIADPQHTQASSLKDISLHVAEEVPIALVYNGISHVVLMATPEYLLELAYGFSFSENIIQHAQQIYAVQIKSEFTKPEQQSEQQSKHVGITVNIELASSCFASLKQRRRQMAGRTGCGVCGIEALSQLEFALPVIQPDIKSIAQNISTQQIEQGFHQLFAQQPISQLTGGCHAAALLQPNGDLQVFEDVGRHNALDKLIGWRLLNGNPNGALLLTSRLSYELIQKAAFAQIGMVAAISAPTAMAIRLAQKAGIKLAVFVREGRLTWIS